MQLHASRAKLHGERIQGGVANSTPSTQQRGDTAVQYTCAYWSHASWVSSASKRDFAHGQTQYMTSVCLPLHSALRVNRMCRVVHKKVVVWKL
jgi:hypothetical protein